MIGLGVGYERMHETKSVNDVYRLAQVLGGVLLYVKKWLYVSVIRFVYMCNRLCIFFYKLAFIKILTLDMHMRVSI